MGTDAILMGMFGISSAYDFQHTIVRLHEKPVSRKV